MAKPIDHDRKKGGRYGHRAPMDEESRRKRSEAMKAFNRNTGLGTIMGNLRAAMKRAKPKP